LRPPIVVILAMLLGVYAGPMEALVWLGLMLSAEGFEAWRRQRLLDGAPWRGPKAYAGTLAISLLWVAHAVIMWRVGGEVPRFIALMDLFTVSVYAAIGAHRDRPLMLCLMAGPLVTLAGLLIGYVWEVASPLGAALTTIATLGTCATILGNGLAMHASDRELAEANKSLADMAESARAANAAKDSFLATMSHEIRTPLNGVIGVAAALGDSELTPRQREMVGLIYASGSSLQHLLSDLLDLSKIEAGKLTLTLEPVNLRGAVEQAAVLFRASADEKGLALKIVHGENARGAFLTDPVRLRQILANLVSNAIKFTEKGEVSVRLDVSDGAGPQDPCDVRIEVRDTGVGFGPDVARRLFLRFEQADSAIMGGLGGSGLGLSICRALAEAMGGAVTARSMPGEGSVFDLRLPLKRAASASGVDAPIPDPAPLKLDADGPVHVLVAEDNGVSQQVMRLLLEPLGATVEITGDGAQAVKAYQARRFDLVLLDMQMPVLDGLCAARAIRSLERDLEREGRPVHTPIVMVSANAMPDHLEQARAAGCDLHLSKPITPNTLAATLAQALQIGRGTLKP
jgi:signal transduction histidine kinase/CheY-like chemotaxis protein